MGHDFRSDRHRANPSLPVHGFAVALTITLVDTWLHSMGHIRALYRLLSGGALMLLLIWFIALSLIFGAGTAFMEWCTDAKKDGYDFIASLFTSLLKAIIVALIVSGIILVIVAAVMFGFQLALPVVVVGALAIALSISVNYAIEVADKLAGRAVTGNKTNGDGIAGVIAPCLRKAGEVVCESYEYLKK